ncbi:retron Ec48 family effector membrane protein [Acinetobacter guillouiae]|uniref:retron Ec48 family effector membrane protein n=1 Tax=Acinetobacter guillouiae TaxID=106649 RepID=UPI0028CFF804|nr:retron Ec48 family effector membrane protein [Acinetobacter guillouiae]
MSTILKKEADLIYSIIEKLWLVTAMVVVYFWTGNSLEILKQGYSIKISSLGLKNFLELNEYIFQIPVFSTAITTILLGWITVKIYLSTYFTTHENNINNQEVNRYSTYLKHYENFLMMLEIKTSKLKYLSPNSIDKLALYTFIFPNVKNGDLRICNDYTDVIDSFNNSIDFLNKNLPKKLGYIDHIDLLISQSKKMGIALPQYERKQFLKIEHELYDLINHINKNLDVSDIKQAKYSIY